MEKQTQKSRALTTGQAASYCFVTPDTILNWINDGILPAQQTAGGRYRIRIESLREFMQERGMSIEALDENMEGRPSCWDYHRSSQTHHRSEYGTTCKTCIIFKSQARNCWVLRGFLPMIHCRSTECGLCDYYTRWVAGKEKNATNGK